MRPTHGAVQRWIWCSMHGRERLANTVFSQVRSWKTFCSVAMPSRTAPAPGNGPKYR